MCNGIYIIQNLSKPNTEKNENLLNPDTFEIPSFKEVDLCEGTQLLQISGKFVFTILYQSHVSIKVTLTDFILFQRKA